MWAEALRCKRFGRVVTAEKLLKIVLTVVGRLGIVRPLCSDAVAAQLVVSD